VRHDPLDGTIALAIAFDGGSDTTLGVSDTQGSSGSGNLSLDGNTFRKAQLTVTLTRGDASPILTRCEMRATGVLGRHTQWEIPLVIADTYDLHGNQTQRNVVDDTEHLMSLIESGRVFRTTINGRSHTTYAHDYRYLLEDESADTGFQGTYILIVREMR
jgi:hypothetical protein